MLEYEFETVQCDYGAGYSLFGGVGLETDGHRETILRRAAEGWRYAGFVPRKQRAGGFIESIDLRRRRRSRPSSAGPISTPWWGISRASWTTPLWWTRRAAGGS